MKNKVLILTILFAINFSNAQLRELITIGKSLNSNKSKKKHDKLVESHLTELNKDSLKLIYLRIPNELINSPAKKSIVDLQTLLENCKESFEVNKDFSINSVPMEISNIKRLDENWNVAYYENEYDFYRDYLKSKENAKRKLRNDEIKERLKQDKINDSLRYANNPYLNLEQNLAAKSNNKFFTIFIGIDQSFANIKFANYLQDDLQLASVDFKVLKSKTTEKYIPKSSQGGEYLFVNYFTKKTDDKPYYETDDGKSNIITKLEVEGTTDLIIRLFLSYWPQQIKIGGYRTGEIAHFEFWGDKISLFGISQNKCKIVVEQGNLHPNYYENFKIK